MSDEDIGKIASRESEGRKLKGNFFPIPDSRNSDLGYAPYVDMGHMQYGEVIKQSKPKNRSETYFQGLDMLRGWNFL